MNYGEEEVLINFSESQIKIMKYFINKYLFIIYKNYNIM